MMHGMHRMHRKVMLGGRAETIENIIIYFMFRDFTVLLQFFNSFFNSQKLVTSSQAAEIGQNPSAAVSFFGGSTFASRFP